MHKVYIVNTSKEYEEMFLINDWDVVDSIEEADLIQFTGGSDVSPHLYGEKAHPRTQSNIERDLNEKAIFDNWVGEKKMAGICRGGQFLNVMCGGKMYQHHSGHPYIHKAYLRSGAGELNVSSTHHQIMRPSEDGEILLVAEQVVTAETMEEGVLTTYPHILEVEAVAYPDQGVLCFQPHPEFAVNDIKVVDCMMLYMDMLEVLLDE